MSVPMLPKRKSVVGHFADMRNDYDMSRGNRYGRTPTGLAPQGGTADWHYRTSTFYYQDIEKARELDRNDSIVGQCIDRAVANIIQDGFSLDPQTGDKALDKELLARWQEWSADADYCDIAGEFTFHDFETHAMRSTIRDGDCVVLGLDTGHLQFIEGHSIQTNTTVPDTVLGVTKDEFGKRIKYWIMRDGITPNDQKERAEPVDVRDADGYRNLFHIYNPKRMSQTRGVTALAPIFSIVGMLDDIQFAKLVQQQVASCFAIFRQQTASSGTDLPTKTPSYGSPSTETTSAGTRYLENIAPGMEIIGAPGEELKGFSPDMPSAGYFEQVSLILQTIGVNLGLPLCLVLMDGKETNFSGWRGAVDEARKGFKSHQTNLVNRFHKPTYEWKVSQWIADDRALNKPGVFRHKWNAPRWSYIEPVNDSQSRQMRMQNTLTSRRRMHAEDGDEWDVIKTEQIQDNAAAIREALVEATKLNTEFPGANVQWFNLIGLPLSVGVQTTLQDPKAIEAQQQGGPAIA